MQLLINPVLAKSRFRFEKENSRLCKFSVGTICHDFPRSDVQYPYTKKTTKTCINSYIELFDNRFENYLWPSAHIYIYIYDFFLHSVNHKKIPL